MKLHSLARALEVEGPIIAKITTTGMSDSESRKDYALLWKDEQPPEDTSGYLAVFTPRKSPSWKVTVPLVHSISGLDYLSDGDVVSVSGNGFVRTLYRRNSPHNFILATDQCNSYCLMCSQPPKQINDFGRIEEHLRLIELI